MRNHNQKLKDMAESVLPSTGRRAARHRRRNLHHAERARTRQALHEWVSSSDRDNLDVLPRSTYRRGIGEMVDVRRVADKIRPLKRWALRKVDADPVLASYPHAQQVDAFRALLPDNLIGRHALSHIDAALHWREWRAARAQPHSLFDQADSEYEITRAQVLVILEGGRHKELNRRIKEAATGPAVGWRDIPPRESLVPNRLLLGAHDVDAFAAHAIRDRSLRRLIDDLATPL